MIGKAFSAKSTWIDTIIQLFSFMLIVSIDLNKVSHSFSFSHHLLDFASCPDASD